MSSHKMKSGLNIYTYEWDETPKYAKKNYNSYLPITKKSNGLTVRNSNLHSMRANHFLTNSVLIIEKRKNVPKCLLFSKALKKCKIDMNEDILELSSYRKLKFILKRLPKKIEEVIFRQKNDSFCDRKQFNNVLYNIFHHIAQLKYLNKLVFKNMYKSETEVQAWIPFLLNLKRFEKLQNFHVHNLRLNHSLDCEIYIKLLEEVRHIKSYHFQFDSYNFLCQDINLKIMDKLKLKKLESLSLSLDQKKSLISFSDSLLDTIFINLNKFTSLKELDFKLNTNANSDYLDLGTFSETLKNLNKLKILKIQISVPSLDRLMINELALSIGELVKLHVISFKLDIPKTKLESKDLLPFGKSLNIDHLKVLKLSIQLSHYSGLNNLFYNMNRVQLKSLDLALFIDMKDAYNFKSIASFLSWQSNLEDLRLSLNLENHSFDNKLSKLSIECIIRSIESSKLKFLELNLGKYKEEENQEQQLDIFELITERFHNLKKILISLHRMDYTLITEAGLLKFTNYLFRENCLWDLEIKGNFKMISEPIFSIFKEIAIKKCLYSNFLIIGNYPLREVYTRSKKF